jgi:excisionase family DNA binding protein
MEYTSMQVIGLLGEILEKVNIILNNIEVNTSRSDEEDKWLTIQEASALLNLAKQTLYAKVSKNEIPYSKRGKKLYFLKSELTEYISSGKKKTSEDLMREAQQYLVSRGMRKAF